MDATPPVVADPAATPPAAAASAMVFVHDRDSEGVIRQCLIDLAVAQVEYKNGGVNEAIAALATRPSPRLLIVDINGVDDPVARIHDLANVCDPTTGVLVIGANNDISLYRELRAAGVVEYYYTPLVRTLVLQSCNAIITGSSAPVAARTGKLIFVVGVRGGAGATTITAASAWHLAEVNKRRVCLLDLDLQFGDAALQLNASPSHALREALDHPERVDDLFLDRGIARVGERLGVMAALEPLDGVPPVDESAVQSLLERLMRHNRYVFVDIPMTSAPSLMRVMHLPSTVLLISSGSLVSARDVPRLREKLGANSAERTTIHILNKGGAAESLPDEEFFRAAGSKPDIVLSFAREIAIASRLGIKGLAACSALQRGLTPLFQQLSGEEPAPAAKWSLKQLFG